MNPLTFAHWQSLPPADAAHAVHARIAALPPPQRSAIFVRLESEDALAARFFSARSFLSDDAPLAGIPCVLKDLYDVAGQATRAGSTFLPQERPTPLRHGALANKLVERHLVLAGKTHLHEFAYGITGENPHYGDVEHPRFPGRTSGGSSSGSAAVVAAGIIPLAFGTDTAGSIRVPAAFCGLYGYRHVPHHDWIADAFPLSPSFDTPGWFTANASDLRAVNRELLGIKSAPKQPLRGAWFSFGDIDPALAAAQAHAAQTFASTLPAPLADPLRAAFAAAPAAFAAVRAPEAWQIHSAWVQKYAADYDPVVLSRVLAGRDVPLEAQTAAQATRAQLDAALASVWERYDFLVLPATPVVAPTKAECTQALRDRIFALTTPISLAGLPTLSVPVALDGGYTTGLQIVAPADRLPVFDALLGTLK